MGRGKVNVEVKQREKGVEEGWRGADKIVEGKW